MKITAKMISLAGHMLMAAVLCQMTATAAEPVLKDGKAWITEDFYTFDAPATRPQTRYEVAGDTIVSGRDCKKVVMTGLNTDIPSMTFAWYEEDGRGYCHDFNASGEFVLMYDLSAQAGEKVGNAGLVLDTFTMTLSGIERRVVKVEHGAVENTHTVIYNDYWIEGVGPVNGRLAADQIRVTSGSYYYGGTKVLKCYDGERLIFDRDEFDRALKEVTAIDGIALDCEDGADDAIYDLNGIRVSDPEPGKIYISKGKKLLWR